MFKNALIILATATLLNADAYQDWLKSQQSEFTSYKKSIDEEFSSMLKKDWEAFQQMSNPNPYKKPKPKKIPQVKKEIVLPKKEIEKSPKVIVKEIKKKQINTKPKVIEPKISKKIKEQSDIRKISFEFYGNRLNYQIDKKLLFSSDKINKDTIIKFWDTISKTNFQLILEQIKDTKKTLGLNDWATYQLTNKIGNEIFKNKNIANLFSWFNLVKLGFDTKVGYNKNNIYLLSVMDHELFQIAYFKLGNKKYYVLTPNGRIGKIGTIFTYSGNYPKSTNKLSFAIDSEIKFYTNLENKVLKFNYEHKLYAIKTQYSKDLIEFYKTYPQSDYNIYYNTKNSTVLSNTILDGLSGVIQNRSQIEAVNMLLRFVQTTFAYKTDQDQFNYEKVMFPEETIYYPYSDCEDRSIMFSYLVKNLLGLDVVGIKYSDHMATAVAFSSQTSGDRFRYKNKVYTITDPTYINANSGMAMPQYKNSKFEIFTIR